MSEYDNLLRTRQAVAPMRGLNNVPALSPAMFPYQRDVTEYLLRCGRGAAFLDTGLGKSLIALEWGRIVAEDTGKPVLMLAPLAVAPQHVREAHKFGLEARIVRDQSEIGPGVNVTNYAKIEHFDASAFGGVVLDESSIIKYVIFPVVGTAALLFIAYKSYIPLPAAPVVYAPVIVGVYLAAGLGCLAWALRPQRRGWMTHAGAMETLVAAGQEASAE